MAVMMGMAGATSDHWRMYLQLVLMGLAMVLAVGCTSEQPIPRASPAPVITGPTFLHGTIGSYTDVRGSRALLVSGYGFVTRLDRSGSVGVPSHLRQWYLNHLRKRGIKLPAKALADPTTAVVKVEGLIPPGAAKGTRFDVLVSALDGTQTTSLEGGVLYTTDLAVGGANRATQYSPLLATARGTIYVDASDEGFGARTDHTQLLQKAVVISGGVVSSSRRMKLVLNHPSWTRSGLIADRINERFPIAPIDREPTAKAIDDTTVMVTIPKQYTHDPQHLMGLIDHLYLERSLAFEPTKAQHLADLLLVHQGYASQICLAFESLGKTVLPVIRKYYRHEKMAVRLASLEAGARLRDEKAVVSLVALGEDTEAGVRHQAADLLVHLPHSLSASRALYQLLDDQNQGVRLAAYESLAKNNDPRLRRTPIGHRDQVKFILDLVPAEKPLIYVVQDEFPRIAVFNLRTPFQTPLRAQLWDNRLMLKADSPDAPIDVFYQPHGGGSAKTLRIAPTVSNFVRLLGHRSTVEMPFDGLDLTYSQVVHALSRLCANNHVAANVVVRRSSLATAIAQFHKRSLGLGRPDTTIPAEQTPDVGKADQGAVLRPQTIQPKSS